MFGARQITLEVRGLGAGGAGGEKAVDELRDQVEALERALTALREESQGQSAALQGVQERQEAIYRLLSREGLLKRGRTQARVA
jgi:molecular chaperone GrpE (heat shock protein)